VGSVTAANRQREQLPRSLSLSQGVPRLPRQSHHRGVARSELSRLLDGFGGTVAPAQVGRGGRQVAPVRGIVGIDLDGTVQINIGFAASALPRRKVPEFDIEAYRHGDLTPVYFGSALKNFGVTELIDAISSYAPPPRPQPSEAGPVEPSRDEVTGFVFKVQANMDPQHRDRIAFMRMVSGTFRRGMKLVPSGLGKPIAVHSPILFFAQDRELADTAEAGDIIGIPNHGTLRVGDTLSEKNDVRFTGLPNFAPEILRRVQLVDPTKTKQLRKALDDLSEEGVIQVFYPEIGSQWIVGVVGQLQLEVLVSRLQAEYKVEAGLEPAPFATARWLKGPPGALDTFAGFNRANIAKDRDGDPVFLAKSAWDVGYQQEKNPELAFSAIKER